MQDHNDNRAAEADDAASRKQLAAPVQRVGPVVTVLRSCSGCAHVRSVGYSRQGDSGRDVYCDHPGAPEDGHIGDTQWDTPAWCPAEVRIAAENVVDAVLREVGFEAGLGAVGLAVEQATARIVQRAIDAAYAGGALDMRTRAAAELRDLAEDDRRHGVDYGNPRAVALDAAADDIEALDVEVPQ